MGVVGKFTPWVVEGSSRGMEGWNSPWALVTESGLRAAMLRELRAVFVCCG